MTDSPAESRYAENGDIRIHYKVMGEGPLVICQHGFPDYHGSWDEIAPRLARAGYRVAAPDLRGYNLSSAPDEEDAYEFPRLLGDAAAVMAAEGRDRMIYVGHDWGGAIGWQIAIHRPEWLSHLVILSTPHPTNFAREMRDNPRQQEMSAYARRFQQPGAEDDLTAEGLAALFIRADDPRRAGYIEAFERSNFKGMLNYYRVGYARTTAPKSADVELPKIPVPTLVLHGMKDIALTASGHNDVWDRVAADTSVLMLPEAGHFLHHDQPGLVAGTLLNWLSLRPAER